MAATLPEAGAAREPARAPRESAEWRARRLEALAALVPPLVHKLGNALGAVMGLVDLAHRRGPSGANPSWLRDAGGQARVSHDLVQHLARLAKPPSGRTEPEDLAVLAQQAHELLLPLAQARGARSAPVRVRGAAVLRVDGAALLHWFAVAGAEALAAPADGGRDAPRPAAVRLAVRQVADGAELSVCVAWRERVDPPRCPPCAPHATADGHDVVATTAARPRATRAVLRLVARDARPAGPDPVLPSARARSGSAQLVLLEPDDALADLVEMVLSEAGYAVERAADGAAALRSARGGGADLVLVGPHGLAPGDLDALARAATPGARCAIALLGGAPAGPAAALPRLAKPFRPSELLDYVAGTLAARG